MINRDRMVTTFCELVSIDSPSGEEDAIAADLQQRLEDLGLTVQADDYGNLIANEGRESPLLLSAHMDTVEPGRGIKPRVEGDRIVADGTTILGADCKAGVAAILEALQSVKEDGAAHIPIEACITRAEEPGLLGARELDYSRITAAECIVFDSPGPPSRVISAAPTYVGFQIDIQGRAAHAGVEPEKGVPAIRVAAEIITRLPQGRLDEETTFNVGTIEGGQVRNAVPEYASLVGEFRTTNAKTLDRIQQQLTGVLAEVRKMYPNAVINDNRTTDFEAYVLTSKDKAVRRIDDAMRTVGLEMTMAPSGGGSDGNIFRQRGIEAVVVGMGAVGMHTLQEYVNIPDMVDTARLCEALVRE
jgi:tripeptide aminopeptidase